MLPLLNFRHTRAAPELLRFDCRVLETTLNLDPFVWPNQLAQNHSVTYRSIKRLMTSALVVVHILPDYSPVSLLEGRFAQDIIRVSKAVEDEPGRYLAFVHRAPHTPFTAMSLTGATYSCVRPSLSF